MISPSLTQILFIMLLLMMLLSLAAALKALILNRNSGVDLARMLTVRVCVSVCAFALLIGGFYAGLWKPHGIVPPSAHVHITAPKHPKSTGA